MENQWVSSSSSQPKADKDESRIAQLVIEAISYLLR